MEITKEISTFLYKLKVNGGEAERNTELFLYHHGFTEAEWPTMRESGAHFEHTFQWAQQIISRQIESIKKVPLRFVSIHEFVSILANYWVIDSQYLARILVGRGIVRSVDECNISGLLRLATELGYCLEYEICHWDLSNVQRKEFKRSESYCIVDKTRLGLLKFGCTRAKTFSSDFGLVKFSYLKEELQDELQEELREEFQGEFQKVFQDEPIEGILDKFSGEIQAEIDFFNIHDNSDYFEALARIITKNNQNYWLIDGQGELYFHIGGYAKDGFLSCLGRIFDVTKRVRINELAEAMRRPIQKRQGRKASTLLPRSIVEQFITQYPYLHEDNGYVTFSGEVQPLENAVEMEAVFFLQERGGVFFRELLNYLMGRGDYGIDNIKAAIFHSPIISVSKARGRDFLYQLIGSDGAGEIVNATPDEILEDMEGNSPGKRLEKAREEAKRVGEEGERLVNAYLEKCKKANAILDFHWESQDDQFAPFDFWVKNHDGPVFYIDAKSTAKPFETDFFISYGELQKMQESDCYVIFRVYLINDTGAKMRVSANMKTIASEVLTYMEHAPYGVLPESVMLNPNRIDFYDEICLSESLI